MSKLKERYEKEIKYKLKEELGYKSIMAVPRIDKVVLNIGVGRAALDKKFLTGAIDDLTLIAGQKAVPTTAKKSISNFKVRDGMAIGTKVVLRNVKAYDFLERLIYIALPRVRDFQGIPRKGFDGAGNYNLGVKEHTIFPEISYEKIDSIKGLNITITTSANTDEEAISLLTHIGLPFRKR